MTTLREQTQTSQSNALHPSTTPRVGTEARKPYTRPAIIYSCELETRAGSPLAIDPLNPFNLPGQGLDE